MGTTILYLEDCLVVRDLIARALAEAGYQIISASNGKVGKDLMSKEIDMVLTDYLMPKMTGVEFIQQIRNMSEFSQVPILLYSSDSKRVIENKHGPLHDIWFLEKTHLFCELVEFVNNVVSKIGKRN